MNGMYEKCSFCGNNENNYIVKDLTFDVMFTGERIIIPNLTGFQCSKCGKVFFDLNSNRIIEKYTKNRAGGGYELKISVVGGGKVGIYFPKDVIRVMEIKKSERAILTPLSRRKMIIELIDR